MLERGLQFTERRSLKPNGALITPFFARFSSADSRTNQHKVG